MLDEADQNLAGSMSSNKRQRLEFYHVNLLKTYHNDANTGGITKIALKLFLDFYGHSR